MTKNHPLASFDRSEALVVDRLAPVQRVCLVIVTVVAGLTLGAWGLSGFGVRLPLGMTLMKVNTALALLASAVSLILSAPNRSRRSLIVSRLLAIPVALLASASLLEHAFGISLGVDTLFAADAASYHPGLMSPQSGSSFLVLAVVLVFMRAENGIARHIADLFTASLSFLVLVVLSGFLFGAMSPFQVASSNWTSPQTQVSLALLSFVAFGRRAEYGAFGILIGRGTGSRIARTLTPILLILPFLREFGRDRLIHNRLFAQHYTTAILACSAAALSFLLLLILARYVNGMEKEIHNLSLRDELTGLYNLRGFHLLANQALRLAQRAQLPFSVLFVDLDDLKQINDVLGHSIGSSFLIETGVLLQATFRETDVIGRIGGDEFVVAGQFSFADMSAAARRLEEESVFASPDDSGQIPLSFSLGYVTTGFRSKETLEDLLARADKAMYEHKKGRKLQPR